MSRAKSVLAMAALGLLLLAAPVRADAASAPRPPQWYEVAAGVLAIPAAVVGLVYSYLLVKKTRLESRKTELEIREKEAALQRLVAGQAEVMESVIQPLIERYRVSRLLLRFVVLYLVIHAWGAVEAACSALLGGAYLGARWLVGFPDPEQKWIQLLLLAVISLPKLVYWVVFFALAWPLFKDVNAVLGMNLREMFSWKKGRA